MFSNHISSFICRNCCGQQRLPSRNFDFYMCWHAGMILLPTAMCISQLLSKKELYTSGVDTKVDGRIMREEVQELIGLSVSSNKLSKLKVQAEEYATWRSSIWRTSAT